MNICNIIHLLKAESGDCVLLQLANKRCILIDCGYKSTYEYELKPLLLRLSSEDYVISLLIITHYDEDHIGGAISFLKDNGDNLNPNIIQIEEIWFNGIFNLIKHSTILQKHVVEKLSSKNEEKYGKVFEQFLGLIGSGAGLISANLAQTFELLCEENHYNLNSINDGRPIVEGVRLKQGEYSIRCLNPNQKLLLNLESWINKVCIDSLGPNYELKKKDFLTFLQNMLLSMGREAISDIPVSQIGVSPIDIDSWIGTSSLAPMNDVNRASIVVEMSYKGRKFLFMADSESSDWIKVASNKYDFVKISHHGTTKPNIALLESIKFNKAFISTNGRRNHPEDEFLARLIKSDVSELYFNYDIRRKAILSNLELTYKYKTYFGKSKIYF